MCICNPPDLYFGSPFKYNEDGHTIDREWVDHGEPRALHTKHSLDHKNNKTLSRKYSKFSMSKIPGSMSRTWGIHIIQCRKLEPPFSAKWHLELFFYDMTYRNLGLENAWSMRIIETFQTMDINTISQEMECYGMMTLCHWCPVLHLFKKTLKPGSYLQNGSFDVIWICLHSMLTKWVRPVQLYEIGFRQYDSTNVHCSAWSPPSRKWIVWQSGRTLRKKQTNMYSFEDVFSKRFKFTNNSLLENASEFQAQAMKTNLSLIPSPLNTPMVPIHPNDVEIPYIHHGSAPRIP